MAENNSVSFDSAIAAKLSEMLTQANTRIAALSVMVDVKDAQIKDLKAKIERGDDNNE